MQLTRQLDGGAWRHLVVKVGKSIAATFRCVQQQNAINTYIYMYFTLCAILVYRSLKRRTSHERWTVNWGYQMTRNLFLALKSRNSCTNPVVGCLKVGQFCQLKLCWIGTKMWTRFFAYKEFSTFYKTWSRCQFEMNLVSYDRTEHVLSFDSMEKLYGQLLH